MKPTLLLLAAGCALAVTVFTDDFDNSRTNWNASETILTPTAIQGASFGKAGVYAADGFVYARPLYVPAITVGGVSRNLLIVVSMHESVYAFNADAPGSAALWHAGPLGTSRTSYPNAGGFFYAREVGCLATPVADVANNRLYVLCTNSTPTWVLYQLNLQTGATVGSVVISGQVVGTGDPTGPAADLTSGANLLFYPDYELGRSGLTLANGNVYATFAGYDDVHPWHGWVIGYNTSALAQIGIVCMTPNNYGGGIWHSSGGLTVDGSGNLYAGTGNGLYDGSTAFANSVVKMSSTLAVTDWYTPSNWAAMQAGDWDISSGRPMLIPSTNLIVVGEKDFNVYSINSTCMGHLAGTVGCTGPQIFVTNNAGVPSNHSGIYGGMFMNGIGYFPNVAGQLYAFTLTGSTWNTTPVTSSASFSFPGVQITGSSNGASTGVVWGLSFASGAYGNAPPGTLRAFDPSTLSELWNSGTLAANNIGTVTKYAAPVVANGKVFVASANSVTVFGLTATNTTQNGGSLTTGGVVSLH